MPDHPIGTFETRRPAPVGCTFEKKSKKKKRHEKRKKGAEKQKKKECDRKE